MRGQLASSLGNVFKGLLVDGFEDLAEGRLGAGGAHEEAVHLGELNQVLTVGLGDRTRIDDTDVFTQSRVHILSDPLA